MPYGTSIPYSVYGNTNIYINKTPGDAALHESTPAHTVHRSRFTVRHTVQSFGDCVQSGAPGRTGGDGSGSVDPNGLRRL